MDNSDKKENINDILPTQSNGGDWAEWAFDHKEGLLITVISILFLAIVFMSYKIGVGNQKKPQAIIVFDVEQDAPPLAPDMRQVSASDYDFSDVRNRISNESAAEGGGSRGMAGKEGDALREAYQQAEALDEQNAANREAYQQGLAGIEAGERAARSGSGGGAGTKGGGSGSSGSATQGTGGGKDSGDTRVKGNVTASFSLINPLRTSVRLYIPAYRCQGGGRVVVNIAVNRNGVVTNASVDRNQSDNDACLTEMAVEAARNSRFNTDTLAPESQRGTITYIFIPQ